MKNKVDLGAEYIVTQMFFDNKKYFDFVDRCRQNGITIPIIPGLKPLATERQLDVLSSVFHIEMPQELITEVRKVSGDKEAIKQVGVEWAIQQSKELKDGGAPCLHYYTMSKSGLTKRIVKEVF